MATSREFQEALHLSDVTAAQIAHSFQEPPRAPKYQEPSRPLLPEVAAQLKAGGLEQLFTHQAEALDHARRGENIMIVTGTSSGKTMCYNLPVAESCLMEPVARALYIFPTKALAQDQLGKLEGLLGPLGIRASTFDGDTAKSGRASIKKLANVVLTNPDMLHVGILPNHETWSKFLKSLRYIVLDEMHSYRGVFGSHVGGVIRRLLRLCEWHKSRPQIIACSATIGNPEELFRKLTGQQAHLVDNDGSARGQRTFVFWNPPELSPGQRLSNNKTTAEIMVGLAESNLRTLAFSRARVSAELVLRYAVGFAEGRVPADQFESYRAGYTVKERRQIEKRLFSGSLLALSSTNAMELGVDVGALDAVIMNGYPGTISAFWQQAGRAGRGTKDGLAILVAREDPMEQYLMRAPSMVLEARNESVSLNPENQFILPQQLRCACHERAMAPSEFEKFGESALEIAEGLDRSGELEFRAGRFFYPSHDPPAPKINIRGSTGRPVVLMVDGIELGEMEMSRAIMQAHEGAVYLHRGDTYLVEHLDLEAGRAELTKKEVPYYTQSLTQSIIKPLYEFKSIDLKNARASLTSLTVTDITLGFKQKSLDGDTVLGIHPLELPPQSFDTVGVRFDFLVPITEEDQLKIASSVHGAEHALLAIAPLLAGCDRGDLGSVWYSSFEGTLMPALFIFDRAPGGVGLSEKLFAASQHWMVAACDLLKRCDCKSGCPACIFSSNCESNNEVLGKAETIALLEQLIQR